MIEHSRIRHQEAQNSLVPLATLTAGCKINLFLNILGTRSDGYHELDTLFYPLDAPHDTLELFQAPQGNGLSLDCNRKDLCTDRNILHTTWRLYAKACGRAPDIHIRLTKNIPDGAGLGGGSSDAATFLNYLNTHAHGPKLDTDELNTLAARIGADVPFFLRNSPARATGIGEQLTLQQVNLSGFVLLLACPAEHVSTPWAFGAWDAAQKTRNISGNIPDQLTSSAHMFTRPSSRALWLYNSFESVVFTAFPKLRAYKELLIKHGAAAAVMSGSGASLFALYREMEKALNASESLEKQGVLTFIHHL